MLFQVQEDLQALKDRIINQGGSNIDITALESAIKKTQHGIRVSHLLGTRAWLRFYKGRSLATAVFFGGGGVVRESQICSTVANL